MSRRTEIGIYRFGVQVNEGTMEYRIYVKLADGSMVILPPKAIKRLYERMILREKEGYHPVDETIDISPP